MRKLKKSLIGVVPVLLIACSQAQQLSPVSADRTIIPFDSEQWEFYGEYGRTVERKVEKYLGKKSLLISKGLAVVKDAEFTDGIIEYDIAVNRGRGFFSVLWHLQDPKNYEEFYIRTHQSGNPDANQYTPVFNGSPGWQLYYGDGYGAPIKYSFGKWMHVKVIVSGDNAEVYIEDMDTPLLFINDLKHDAKSGKIGVKSGGVGKGDKGGVHFANFSYTAISNPPLKGKAKKLESTQKGAIMSWSISEAFDEKSLDGRFRLAGDNKPELTWQKLTCERSGLANISRVQAKTKGKNTVFAKVSRHSAHLLTTSSI